MKDKGCQRRNEAITDFLNNHAAGLKAYIHRKVGNPNDVDDLYQETLTNACEKYQEFKGDCKFATWVTAIAKHKIAHFYRDRENKKFVGGLEQLSEDKYTPEKEATQQERLSTVSNAIEKKDPKLQLTFIMHAFGHSYKDIAKKMKTQPNTVKMRLARMHESLKEPLSEKPEYNPKLRFK